MDPAEIARLLPPGAGAPGHRRCGPSRWRRWTLDDVADPAARADPRAARPGHRPAERGRHPAARRRPFGAKGGGDAGPARAAAGGGGWPRRRPARWSKRAGACGWSTSRAPWRRLADAGLARRGAGGRGGARPLKPGAGRRHRPCWCWGRRARGWPAATGFGRALRCALASHPHGRRHAQSLNVATAAAVALYAAAGARAAREAGPILERGRACLRAGSAAAPGGRTARVLLRAMAEVCQFGMDARTRVRDDEDLRQPLRTVRRPPPRP